MLPPALHRFAATVLHALGLFHPLRDWRRDRRFAAAGRIALKNWATTGRAMPAPDLLKYAVLRENARRHGLVVLVETGTFYGNAVFTLRNEFEEIHSIELAPDLHAAARRELGHLRHLHLHFGDSAEVLPKVAEQITSPALYWLDGHFCSGPSAFGKSDTPIGAEVDFLLRRPPGRDMILIDDARLFDGDGEYPSLAEVRAWVARHRPNAEWSVETDIIRIFPV